jgi:hypothetical protein
MTELNLVDMTDLNLVDFHNTWKRNTSRQGYFSNEARELRIVQRAGRWYVVNNLRPRQMPAPYLNTGYNRLSDAIEAVWQVRRKVLIAAAKQGVVEVDPLAHIGFKPMQGDELWRHFEYPDTPTKLRYVSDHVVVVRSGDREHAMSRAVFDAEYKRAPAHKVLHQYAVWCDICGEIHRPEPDHYNGNDDCSPEHWRRVYIESYDPDETF